MAIKSKERLWAEKLDHIPTRDEMRKKFPLIDQVKLGNVLTNLRKAFPDRPIGVQDTVTAPPVATPAPTLTAPVELSLRIGDQGANIRLLNERGHMVGTLKATPTGLKIIRPNAKAIPENEINYKLLSALHDMQLS